MNLLVICIIFLPCVYHTHTTHTHTHTHNLEWFVAKLQAKQLCLENVSVVYHCSQLFRRGGGVVADFSPPPPPPPPPPPQSGETTICSRFQSSLIIVQIFIVSNIPVWLRRLIIDLVGWVEREKQLLVHYTAKLIWSII